MFSDVNTLNYLADMKDLQLWLKTYRSDQKNIAATEKMAARLVFVLCMIS